jgi:glucose/arabinose dehydrogenase
MHGDFHGSRSHSKSAAIVVASASIAVTFILVLSFTNLYSLLLGTATTASSSATDIVQATLSPAGNNETQSSSTPNQASLVALKPGNRNSTITSNNNTATSISSTEMDRENLTKTTVSPIITQQQQQEPPAVENTSNNFNYGVVIPDANGTFTRTFGCDYLAVTVTHCDPLPYPFESASAKAETLKLFAVTKSESDIQFAEGVNNSSRALNFHAYYGEFVNITNSQNLNPSAFSVSFWAKKNPTFLNYGQVVSHVNAGRTAGWFFDVSNSGTQSIRFIVVNSDGQMFTPDAEIPLSSDKYTHIVGTFDGVSLVKVYVDGELTGSVPFTGIYTPDPKVALRVGMSAYNFAFPWAGMIDDLRLYDRTLSADEVDTLYDHMIGNNANNNNNATTVSDLATPGLGAQNVSPGADNSPEDNFLSHAIDTSLVGHWPFDSSLNDVSTSGSHATYVIQAISMTFTPDGRMFYTEKNTGKIRVMTANDEVLPTPFATITDLHVNMEQGLMGIVVDPQFEQNHFVYVYYTSERQEENGTISSSEDDGNNNAVNPVKVIPINRVVRFTEENNIGKNMTVILDNIPANPFGMHAGGALAFGPSDGKLYITVGNAYVPMAAQDKDSLLGKVLRINKDGTIPEDNPYNGNPMYSMGHRNMYGIALDDEGNGIITENGDDLYDEINPLVKGGNFGYPIMQPPNMSPMLADPSHSVLPLRSYWKTIAPTQAIFYTGDKYPELKGKFIVGSYNNGRLYAYDLANDQEGDDANNTKITNTANSNGIPHLVQELKIEFPAKLISNAIAVAQSPSGDIYYGGYYIYKLQSIDFGSKKPMMAPIEVKLVPSTNDKNNNNTNTNNNATSFYVDVKNVQVIAAQRGVVLTLASHLMPTNMTFTLFANIPETLLDGIKSVNVYGAASDTVLLSYSAPSSTGVQQQQQQLQPTSAVPNSQDFIIHDSSDGKSKTIELRNLKVVDGTKIMITGNDIPLIPNLDKRVVANSSTDNADATNSSNYPAP